MKISRNWLQTFFDTPLPDAATLSDALTFHVFEIDGVEKINGDDVLDVKVTPNRGHDCLSHRGIAKEVSAILKMPIAHDPFSDKPVLDAKTDLISVSIDDTLCKRYIAAVVRGVKVGESPRWLRERLESMGQRSINNIVDATNFVMFNIGQPLHAFDAVKLKNENGKWNIAVRKAKPGEKMLALDEKEYTLTDSMLVIADANADVAIGIAGIKGGMPAAIDENTTDIIIESANFGGVSVRKTAAALKLRTDASTRFEQVISPEIAAYGMRAVADLIVELAGGKLEGFVDVYPQPQKSMTVSASVQQIRKVLGIDISEKEIEDVFTWLGFSFEKSDEIYSVVVPFERLDIAIPEDLAEEVVRIIGYDAIPAGLLPKFEKTPEVNNTFYWSENIREYLVSQGFSEVFTTVFAEEGERVVLNKVDGVRSFLRKDLRDGLKGSLDKNVHNKELLGLAQVRLFEVGTVWQKGEERLSLGLMVEPVKKQPTLKDFVNGLNEIMSSPKVSSLEPSLIMRNGPGTFEEYNLTGIFSHLETPSSYDDLPVSIAVRYRSFSKYPYIVRDIALWVSGDTNADSILSLIRENAGDLLVRSELFDRFEKNGKVSLAFRLIFQSFDRTLLDTEVQQILEKVSDALREKGYEIR